MAKRGKGKWDAVRLSDLSFAELEALRRQIIDDPANANPEHATGSIDLYSKAARAKLDALGWAVFYKQQEKSKAA